MRRTTSGAYLFRHKYWLLFTATVTLESGESSRSYMRCSHVPTISLHNCGAYIRSWLFKPQGASFCDSWSTNVLIQEQKQNRWWPWGEDGFEIAGDGKFEYSLCCIWESTIVRAVENLEAHYENIGDRAKGKAVASELESFEEDFTEIKRVVREYLNSSPSHNCSLNGSRTTPTGQSATKNQSERLEEEIRRQ